MSEKDKRKTLPSGKKGKEEQANIQGYPLYPPNEDIYSKFREEKDTNPEDVTTGKDSDAIPAAGTNNEKDFKDDRSGGDLDIPGSELDDPQETVGNEDEENNYYSLGGDGHTSLDENG